MTSTTITQDKKFTHDCERCVFLGHTLSADLYFCDAAPTVIARTSSTPEDYVSGIPVVPFDARLAVAYGLAHQKGLI